MFQAAETRATRWPAILAAAVVLATGSACGHADQPEAPRVTEHGAPRVQDPMDPNVRGRPPCALLPDSRLTAAGLPANAERRVFSDAAADACQWDDLTIAWSRDTPSLDALYADRDEQVYFDETAVLGYPAVYANTIDRADGHCVLTVGVTDTAAFYAAARLAHPTKDEACTRAKRAATEVLRTLQKPVG